MPAGAQSWIDGRPASALPLPDRGLDFGDGLFETLPIIEGRIPWRDFHLERLGEGLARLDFPVSACAHARAHIIAALKACPDTGIMRLTVTRGTAERGYTPPPEPAVRYLVQVWTDERVGQPRLSPASLGRSGIALSWQPALAGIKHLNRLEQVLAARERRQSGLDEMLMTDQAGNVISVVSGNLYLVKGTHVLTPELTQCGITGTRRRLLLEELGPALGLRCSEAVIAEADIDDADEVFYSNSLRGYQPVGRYGERRWSGHPVLERLQSLYRERMKTCAA